MCLLGIAFGLNDAFPVMLLANREELYVRPTAGPRLFPRERDSPAWLGGLDLVAGGTWLGVNEWGLIVAVTNRTKQSLPENPPSRGVLCRSLLRFRETASAMVAGLRELEANQFAGCNLLIVDRHRACVIEAGDSLTKTALTAGLHLIANAELNPTGDPRIERVRREFGRTDPANADDWFREARRICQLTSEGVEPAISLSGSDRGTVSSTVIGLANNAHGSRYWYAPGPPASTPYDNYAPLLRQLLSGGAPDARDSPSWSDRTGQLGAATPGSRLSNEPGDQPLPAIEPPDDSPARRAVRENLTWRVTTPGRESLGSQSPAESPYRFFLRGPWQSEPLARVERDETGTLVWSGSELPAAGMIRLPASWQDVFGNFRGRVRFLRRFHPPTNVEADDRLFVVLDGIGGEGIVWLNGRFLGKTSARGSSTSLEVTGTLRTNNELEIDLEYADFSDDPGPGGLFAPVALEIRSPSGPVHSD
jgi:uncharacterized protein with NRDE domain